MLPELNLYTVRAKRIAQIRGKVGLYFVAALSFLAGMTDAIGFTTTGDFVSFISGNTTRLAVSIGADDSSTTFTIAALILTFILGNALGAIVARIVRRRSWPLLFCVGALLCLATLMPTQFLCACVCRAVHGHDQCGGRRGKWASYRTDLRHGCLVTIWTRPWTLDVR